MKPVAASGARDGSTDTRDSLVAKHAVKTR